MDARRLSILFGLFAFACGHAADSDVLERLAVAPGGWIYGYDEINYDIDEDDALTVNYYDNYGFLDLFPGRKADLSYRSKSGYGGRFVSPLDDRSSAVGMLTGRLTACGDSVMVESFYYDHAGRMVQRHSTNHLGGCEHVYLALSFTGNPVRELREHAGGGAETISVLREYEYDGRDRLAKVTHRIGGGETRVLLKNSYDGVGRLAAVETNGGSYRTDYGYNVRGWLTEISSPLMEQTLNYTEHSLRKNPYMNGNINSITTKNNLLSPATGEVMGSGKATVTYMYDKLNRLESSTYEPEGRPSNPGAYNTAYTYDLNGNITMLSRQGVNERLTDDGEVVYAGYGFTDQITATYDGNRLLKVKDYMEEVVYGDAFDFHDGADEDVEYEYDGNGNMTADLNRGIKEITYDVNNRPVSVTFSTRPAEQRTKYLRDASGRKLRTTYQTSRFAILDPGFRVDTIITDIGILGGLGTGVLRPLSSPGIGGTVERWDDGKVQPAENMLWSTNFIRDYCGDIIYKDGEVERILTDNGYAVPDSAGGYDYYYYVKDWQGNVRAVIDEANRRMELNSYYPYGMPMSSTASVQPYKYGGKELDRTNGLDMYDFHARHYDPIVPHFITMDELCEKYPSISPYAYCAGNPILYKDPDGKEKLMAFDPYDSRSKILIPGTYAYPDNNAINVFAHGANDKMSLFLKNPTDGTNYRQVIISTGEEFKSFVEKQLEIRGKSDYEINTIILHSCETGSGDNSIAEQISETYKDVKVIAPDGKLQMNKKGEHSVISNKENSQSGNWIIFENGKAVGAYSNDWQPKDKPTLWDELTKKKQ